MFFDNNKIKSGDRIQCLYDIEAKSGYIFNTINKLGTIITKENGEYGVKFDKYINGHALIDKKGISHCENGYGLWLKDFAFVKINKNKEEIKIKMDNNLIEKMENMTKIMNEVINEIKENKQDETIIYFAKMYNDVIIPSKENENAGYDIYAHFDEEEFNFKPHETRLVPTGLLSACSQEYVLIGKERGSTGSIGMKCGAGIIDSGYRGEIFIAITNDNNIPLIISKNIKKTIKNESFIIYPYTKGIAQLLLVPVPSTKVQEISVNELKSIPSKRGSGKLGSSGR